MFVLDESEELLARSDLFVDPIADVRAIKAGDELSGVLQMQSLDDLFPRQSIGGSGKCDPRDTRKPFGQDGKADVLRAEVVTPLRDAVGFIDSEQRQL